MAASADPASTRGASVAAVPLLLAVLLTGLVVFSPATSTARIDVPAAEAFMTGGPTSGLWRHKSLHGTWDVAVVPHPDEAACLMFGPWHPERGEGCGLRPMPRGRFVRAFVPGPPDLFFRNYRRHSVQDEVLDGRRVLKARWVPLQDHGGETARVFWTDPHAKKVLGFEDRSIDDGLIRSLWLRTERLDDLGMDLQAPPRSDPQMLRCLGQVKADAERGPPDLAALAEQVPFPLLQPLRLPPGFRLTAARHRKLRSDRTSGFAVLEYQDGMALIRVLQGTAEALDAFEDRERGRDERHRDEGTCPSIPEGGAPITAGGLRILRRKDRCRTVLRVDGIEGVSVTIIGRNELSQDAYIEMVESLDLVESAP